MISLNGAVCLSYLIFTTVTSDYKHGTSKWLNAADTLASN